MSIRRTSRLSVRVTCTALRGEVTDAAGGRHTATHRFGRGQGARRAHHASRASRAFLVDGDGEPRAILETAEVRRASSSWPANQRWMRPTFALATSAASKARASRSRRRRSSSTAPVYRRFPSCSSVTSLPGHEHRPHRRARRPVRALARGVLDEQRCAVLALAMARGAAAARAALRGICGRRARPRVLHRRDHRRRG